MNDLFSLNNKRILITGAAGHWFHYGPWSGATGAEIIINGTHAERAEKAAMRLRDEGFKAHTSLFDVADARAVEQAVADIENNIGPIDVLFNNAGIQRRHPFTEFPLDEWNDIIATNQTGVFIVSQCVAKNGCAQKGKIVNICSMQSELGRDTITPYAAAKVR